MDMRCITDASRYSNGISAYKVLAVKENGVLIRMPWGEVEEIQLMGDGPKEGDWIDMQICENRNNGRITSFSAKYFGQTPANFVPDNKDVDLVRKNGGYGTFASV